MLIKNAQIIDANKSIKSDLLIENGKIVKIAPVIKHEGEVIDANGLYLLPGIIDLNFTLQDPGNKSVEKIESAISDALKGGATHIAVMPYTNPTIDSETTMEYVHGKVLGKKGAKLSIIASATLKGEGVKLSEQATLYKNGAIACHIDSSSDSNILRRTFEYAWMQDKTLFVRCKNKQLEAGGVMSDGEISSKLGLPPVISLTQSSEVAKVCEISRYLDTKTLIQTVSTRDSLQIIKNAKQGTKKIFAEVGINYLILNDTACDNFNTFAKVSPPFENEATRKALIEAIKDETIDVISSCHNAQSLNSKDMPFDIASYGISSCGYFLPLVFTYLVEKEGLDFKLISKLLSANPAKIIGAENEGLVEEGYDANLILFDPNGVTKVPNNINSPFCSTVLNGEVKAVWINGEQA
ncbi:MAG: dihydroorotase [Campylobacterota bacterium]|nr:dihydroorotase [Campylobacterota bacterium]